MIFGKPLDRLVLDGTKTRVCRPIQRGKVSGTVKPCPYRPGRDYAVQRGRGLPQIARIEVTDVDRIKLGTTAYLDVRAEGFKTTVAFYDYWMRANDRAWPPTEPCEDCGPFDIGDEACPACGIIGGRGIVAVAIDDQDVIDRFQERHSTTLVWAIRFELRLPPRLLAPAGDGSGFHYKTLDPAEGKKGGRVTVVEHPDDSVTDLGYTLTPARAMRGEPEAIDDQWLKQIVEDSRERWAGDPGRRVEHARRLMRANQERARMLLANHEDPSELLAVLEQQDRHLRLLEQQKPTSRKEAA